MTQSNESTGSGGARLRELREQAGKTQLSVELEADLGTGYLQRVESGRVAQPGHKTVERILDALDVRFGERREVLQAYGYTISIPPPSDSDLVWAREICQKELHEVDFPAYTLDCTLRLVAWNRYLPCLLGLAPGDQLPQRLRTESFLAAWFDPTSPLARLIAEPDVFLPALVRALRYETRLVTSEPWYETMLARLQTLPMFREVWNVVEQEEAPASATRALVPLRLSVPNAGLLQFHLSAEPFLRDPRFRLIYYFPADPPTMEQCAEWAATTPGQDNNGGG